MNEKSWESAFSVSIVLFDILMHSNSNTYGILEIKAIRRPWPKVTCLSTFSKDFSSELLRKFHLNFIRSLQAKGKKVSIICQSQMTEMDAMPIYEKKIILLEIHGADCLEIWYVAFGELVL